MVRDPEFAGDYQYFPAQVLIVRRHRIELLPEVRMQAELMPSEHRT